MDKKLMRLQLPGHWAICYNSFGDEEMIVADGWIENQEHYKEDLLWLQSMRSTKIPGISYELDPAGWLADIGWYPDGDPNGAFTLHIFRLNPTEESWSVNPPMFSSRNRYYVRSVLEYVVNYIWHLNSEIDIPRQQLERLQLLHDQERLAEFLGSVGYL
ncbi:hypothetical protein [Hymenobacter sp. PAMC 26628]|uniref:hypothetical protein n=1 Tax=Hymenobacter sp. PAMC 26628 TaxID=1484118 RepID=UPI0012FF83C4|nr:hypothetical protein [Hymenobacter sp. PAMC 26628]